MNNSSSKHYDVILVDVDPFKKMNLMAALTQAAPYPNLSKQDSAWVLVNMPSLVVTCVELSEAVLLELLIELAGGTVDIRPSKQCV